MSKVSPDQFKNYSFETGEDKNAGTRNVIVSKTSDKHSFELPVASMTIDDSQRLENKKEQELINSRVITHHVHEEPSGQLRWGGGMMEDSIAKVSWLGMDKDAIPARHQPHVLRAMLGVGVEAHGSVPHADDVLSDDGSATARAMNRRYGVKPHPKNIEMEANLPVSLSNDTVRDYLNQNVAEYVDDMAGTHRQFSPEEVASASQRLKDVSDSRRVSKKPKKTDDIPLPGMGD